MTVIVLIFVVFLFGKEKSVSENTESEEKTELERIFGNSEEVEDTSLKDKEYDDGYEAQDKLKLQEAVEDDWRIHGFSYIKLTSQLNVGDYVDIRISFADGGDFVLLSKKKIQGISPLREGENEALWMVVSEEEILRLSSAVVDAYLNEGCFIYAIQYISETQKEAVVNYVVSDEVKQLMDEDPNIVKRAENVQEYSKWKEYTADMQGEEVYPEQEEIIYMD